MALFSKALRSELSHYRRRKTISLDGTVGGMDHPSRRGQYVTPADGALGAGGAPAQHSFYDSHAHYRAADRDYETEPSRFDDAPRATTPALRLDPVPRPERPPRISHAPMTEELMLRAMEDVREEQEARAADPFGLAQHRSAPRGDSEEADRDIGGLPPPDPEMVREMLNEPTFVPIEEHPWFGEQQMTEEAFEQAMQEAVAPEPHDESVADPALSFQEMEAYHEEQQASLEDIVQQAMPEPEEVLEEEEDPWELYQRQMMDPGMMGFGPMPGP